MFVLLWRYAESFHWGVPGQGDAWHLLANPAPPTPVMSDSQGGDLLSVDVTVQGLATGRHPGVDHDCPGSDLQPSAPGQQRFATICANDNFRRPPGDLSGSAESDLMRDMLPVVTSFSGRFYRQGSDTAEALRRRVSRDVEGVHSSKNVRNKLVRRIDGETRSTPSSTPPRQSSTQLSNPRSSP